MAEPENAPLDFAAHRAEAHHLGRLQEFLKQITYGGNDGIVTTFAIVAGFAGASAEGVAQVGGLAVLVFGLANLFADAVSMGLGEFLSTRSQRDLYLAQREKELSELQQNPDQEREELVEMFRARGLRRDHAEDVADRLMTSPELVADMMMSYELEMPDMRTARPAVEGLWTFMSFLAFGAVPLAPYFVLPAMESATFFLSLGSTFLALTTLGILRWSATGERLVRTVGETLLVGGVCAAVAFVVGMLVG